MRVCRPETTPDVEAGRYAFDDRGPTLHRRRKTGDERAARRARGHRQLHTGSLQPSPHGDRLRPLQARAVAAKRGRSSGGGGSGGYRDDDRHRHASFTELRREADRSHDAAADDGDGRIDDGRFGTGAACGGGGVAGARSDGGGTRGGTATRKGGRAGERAEGKGEGSRDADEGDNGHAPETFREE